MNLNEIPAWSDIESQPWFAELTPEEKQQSLTKWQGDMMSFAKDPKEKFAVAATSKAKARSFFGEEMPDDPIADALQRRQKDLEDIGSRYDAFSKGELEEDDEEVLTLNDTLKGNTPYSVIKGRLFVSPQLVWDKAAYEKVVNEAPVDEDERVLAMSAYDGSKERAAEGVVNSLGYTDEAFRDFAAKGFKEGKSNAAILDEWKANNKLPDGILGSLRGVGRQAYFGLRSGLSGLERAMGGLGGFFGSESAQKYAEESGKEAQSYMQRTLGEGPEFIGELTSGAVSIIPTMAAGAAASLFTEGAALPAAASVTAGAIQSAGATQAETYEFYRNQGLDHANALAESRVDGLVSGLITGAITHYAGKLGDKIGLGKGIEGLFSGPASKIASKLTQREISESLKAGAKAVGGSFLQEGSEELLDTAAQDAYSMIKRDPTLTLAEAINNALQAGKVGAVLGGAAEAGKIGLNSLLNSAKFAVPTTEEEEALRAKFEVPAAVEEEVIASPEVQQEEQNIKTAADVVKEAAPVAPQTAAVLAGIAEEKAGELAADVVGATEEVLADIEAEAPLVVDETPLVSPKPPVSPASETAPISETPAVTTAPLAPIPTEETQPPQGKTVETPTNAAPEIPLEESLRQEPQDRVEVRTPEETGVGDSVQRAAEGEKEVGQDQQKFLSDLQFYGTARLGDNTFAIKQASDDSFYIEKTTGGQRSTVASGFLDIEAAQRGAAELVAPTPEEVASTGQPPTLVEEALPERGASVETIASGGGMSVEEARQFLARRSDSGEPLIFGRPFSEISGMQQNERPRVLQASDKLRAVKQVVGDINKFRIPVSQDVVNAYGITLPSGYVKQGDLYVFQPPSPPTTGAVPTETLPDGQKVTPRGVASPAVEAAPEPAPEAQPEQPDAKEKAPTEPSESTLSIAKRFGGRIAWSQGDLAIIEGFQLFGSKSLYVAVVGDRYSLTDFTLMKPEQRKALLGDNEELFLRKREEIVEANNRMLAQNPDGPFTNGQTVVVSKNVPQNVASVFREWVRLLGLGAPTRIVLTTPQDGIDMAAEYGGKFRRIGVTSLMSDNERGQMTPLGEDDFHIFYKEDASYARTLEVLAHELGHILERQSFKNLPDDQRKAIIAEHEKWLKRVGSQKALDGIRELRSMRVGKIHPNFGRADDRFDSLNAYWKSFSEWFADQVARWATTTDKPLTVIEKFFARLGKKLREFFNLKGSQFAPNQRIADWLNSLSPDLNAVVEETLAPAEPATKDSLPVVRDTTKPEQMTPLEYMRKAVGAKFVESVAPGKEEAWWSAKEKQEAPRRYAAGTKMVLEENGRFFVLDLNTNKYKSFGSKREAFLFFKAKGGYSERRYIEALSGKKLDPLSRIDHKIAVDNAVKNNAPVSAETVDAYGIKLPEGYVKQGELYVYEKTQPLPKDDTAGERGAVAPAPTVEPAPEAQPEQPVSQPVQSFRDAVSQMTPTAQAKWTPELRATAEAYLDSGGTTGLQGLSDVQQKVVGRFLPEEVKAAFDAEDARKRAQRNKLPDHRESSLPPTPGKQIRKIGKGAMESVPVVLDEIAKVIPNIRDLVEVRESVEGEPDAEGFYDPQADKAVVLVDNVYLKPQHGGSQEAALRETIIHELLHRGFAKLRQTNPQLFEQFEAFSLADTNDAQFEALVRRGYSMYSNWKDDPAQNQKAREEIFIRKAVVDLNFKGIEAIKSPSSLASQFFSWLRGLLNKLLGRKVDDETLLHWSRVFLNAAQADFIEKTPGERMHAFAGEKAIENLPEERRQFMRDSLDTAKAMAAAGKDSEEIRAVTGWFPGKYDGKMRWEVPDDAAKLKEGWKKAVVLEQFLDHPALFRAYPDIRYVRFDIKEMSPQAGALYESTYDQIAVNSLSEGPKLISDVLHEVQHAIQQREGFSKGSSPKMFKEIQAVPSPETQRLGDKLAQVEAEIQEIDSRMSAENGTEAFQRRGVKSERYVADEVRRNQLIQEFNTLYSKLDSAKREDVARFPYSDAFDAYQRTAGEIEARDVQARQNFTPEQRKAVAPYSSENIAKEDAIVMFGGGGDQRMFSLGRDLLSPEKYARHAELEAKHNAGTITPEETAEAQALVDEAAKAAGFNVGPLYHHGGFDIRENAVPDTARGFHMGTRQAAEERAFGKPVDDFIAEAEITYDEDLGAWFWSSQGTDSYDVVGEDGFSSEASARRSLEEFASQEDFSGSEIEDLGNLTAAYMRVSNPLITTDQKADWEATIKRALASGNDSVQYRNEFEDKGSTSYIALQEGQIKSADPFTGVPLEQRFQPTSPDIRYSLGEPPDMQAEADALREVTPNSQALDKFRETFGTPRQDVGQVLGKKEGSVYTQAQVAPLSQHARNVIGFEVNEEGDPVVNPKATQKALDLVSKLLNTKGYASRFNTQAAKLFEGTPVDPEIASAVLVQELQAYANRLSASSPKAEDQILKAALTPFYNTVILGNYLTLRTAGRALQAAGRVSGTDDARKSREEAEKAVNKEITKQLGDEALPAAEGMDKAGVEGGVDAIKDDIPAPADPTLRLLDLAVESLDEVAKADANAVFDVLLRLGEAEEALERAEKVGNKAMSILTERRTAQELPSTVAELKVLVGNLRVEAADKLAKLRSSLEGAKPETKKKVKEKAAKAGGKKKATPKVSDKEEDPITKEINALAAELGTLSKLDQAGLDVVKQIAKKLVAKFQPAKLDALKDKVEAVVYKYVQNAERLELAEFSEKMTADLDAIGLKKPELQEALVAKAWAYHFAAPTKAVQALTAKMKSAERADRGGPESVANVRKAINGAVNSTEENRDAFVTRLTDQLVALGVEPQAAEAAAKAAFEYRAKQADKKIERVMETLRLGKRRALLKSFQNTKEADRTEEWQRATLKAAFVEAGLTNKQAERGADKAMQEAEAIFATAEMKVAEIKQRGVQKFLDSLASVEDETPVTKTKQDNLRSVFKDATLDEEFNEAVLMDRFQTLGATEAQAKALVEKVAEVREDKAEALAEAKRKQVNKVIDATYKRIAQIESGTPSEKAKKQESLRNAVGAAIKAKEFDEAAFRASVASFGASEPQAETLVQNVKKLRQLGESKPLSKAKLRQFLLSFPKNVLANPEQREALLRSFLKGQNYSETEINRIVPQVLRDFDTGYQKARKAYLDELEKKLKPKQGQKESKQDQQNRKMLNALRSGLADTTSETSVALAKSLGFEAFRPQDDHILSKLDEEMRKLREQDRISDANAKFVQIRDLLNRRRPPRDFMQVAAQGWITSALSSLSNFAVNVWAPLGEAGVRFTSDILRAAATGRIDEIPLYLEAAIQALKSMPPRAKFAFKTDTFTNSVNTLIADMASMKDELQRALNTYRSKDSSKLAKAAAAGRILFTIGDLSRRVLSTVDDTWYTALSSYIGSSNLIKDLRDAKLPKAAVQAIAFHANNDAIHQAQAEHATLDAVSQFVESLRGKTEEEIDAGLEYLGLNDASVTQAQADYIQEIVSALQSLRIRSGATGDDLVKRALKEISNFKAAVNVRAVELGQARTKELLATALTEVGQTPQQIEEAQRNYDENAKKAASFGMGLHRVEGVPSYDIMGKAVQIVDAMGRGAVTTSPLLGRMMVGFFGIPLNLLNKSLWFTPYGLGRYFLAKWQMAKNPEEKFYEYSMSSQREMSQRVNEIIIGHTIMAAAFALGAIRDQEDEEGEGLYITLGGPSNKTEYDAWYARGFRKFSFCYKTKDGSVAAVPYGRGMGEVLKMPLMLLGAFDDMRLNKKLGDREDMSSIIEYLNSAAAGIGNQATFLGAKNTVGAFAPDKIGANTASSIAYAVSNLVPFNGLDRSIAALAVGPPDRSRTGAILANIPIARWLATDPAINVFGDKWGNKSDANFAVLWDRQWNQGLIPLNISAPLTGQDKRLYGFIGERLIGPSPALRGALELRNGYVTDKQWYDYSIYRGQALKREMVTQLDRLRRMDDDSLSKAIAELSTKATKKAKDRFNYK